MRLITFSVLAALLSSCASSSIPKWDGSWWAADSQSSSIILEVAVPDPEKPHEPKKVKTQVKVSDPAFDGFACMSYEDLEKFVDTYVFGCKKWSSP